MNLYFVNDTTDSTEDYRFYSPLYVFNHVLIIIITLLTWLSQGREAKPGQICKNGSENIITISDTIYLISQR